MVISFIRTIFFLFLFSMFTFLRLNAQVNNFKKWSIREGLAQSDVYAITQDHQGYLWIGTGAGISVFDGKTFTNYSKKDGLCGNIVRAIYEDSKKRVWIATENGVSIYNGTGFTKINHESGFKGNSATCILESNNNIFVGTDDGGINIICDSVSGKYKIKHLTTEEGLSTNTILSLQVDKSNNIWAAIYGGGINVIHINNEKSEIKVIKGLDKIPSDLIYSLAIDKEENVWAGTEDVGAFKFNARQYLEGDYNYQLIDEKTGLGSKTIWCVLSSMNGDIWFGSLDKGLFRLHENRIVQFSDKEGLNGNQILSLFQDDNSKVWIGMQGEGLALQQGDHFSHFTKSNGLPDNKVQAIVKDKNQTYWIATSEGGLVKMTFQNEKPVFKTYGEASDLPSKKISCLALGNKSNNNLWIGTNENGIVKFDGKRFQTFTESYGLQNNNIYSITVDEKGIVWIGTANGISRYDGVKFLNVSTEKMLMENEGVKAIVCDKTGNVWFATAGGLARYGGNEKLRTFDEVEGLKVKDVNTLAIDHTGNVWIGTNGGGIYKFDIKKADTLAISLVLDETKLSSGIIKSLLFENDHTLIVGTFKGFDKITFYKNFQIKSNIYYNANDGFIGQECNENALYVDDEKNIWFGTINGLTKYNPNIELKNTKAPSLKLTDVQLFFKSINWKNRGDSVLPWSNSPNKGVFDYTENHFTFKFNTAAFDNPEKLMYSYILEGKDKDWSPLKSISEVTYSGLDPGTYIFKVKALNASEIWSQPQTFSFEITPPWYKTKLFYISSVLLIILLVFWYIKWRERKLIEEKEVLEKIVEERTQEVVNEKIIVEEQKHLIEEKHKEITDSINYAERIQRSFLATDDLLNQHLENYFILFKPKDVVSGDFYWADILSNGNFALATADSTGHGVPGAIMSLLNITSLEKAIEHYTDPAEILNHTRQTIIKRLKKDGSAEGGKDGMDCSLLVFDKVKNQLHIAVANNPVWIIRHEKIAEQPQATLIEIKPDKMPVGKHDRDHVTFNTQIIDLQKGDIIYTLTDGFPDQFGGEKGKKFMSKNLKELLLSNANLPMQEQLARLDDTFKIWVGAGEQIDDVTLIGIKI